MDEAAVLSAIDSGKYQLPRSSVVVDTQQFSVDVEAGRWDNQDPYLREKAAEIRRTADALEDPEIHFAGLADIPHVIALGAYLGAERAATVHEYDRDADRWVWPNDCSPRTVIAENLPTAPRVTASGIAVLRVSISADISDRDVRAAVGDETLADITVRYENVTPGVAQVRSEAEVLAIREKIRDALSAIKAYRPDVEVIHLFVAAPNSVAFVIGQELVPRNTPPIQTYQYRLKEDMASYQPAILITETPSDVTTPLNEADIELAENIRKHVWPKALKQIRNYSQQKMRDRQHTGSTEEPWYSDLEPRTQLAVVAPFPSLPPVGTLVSTDDTVDADPYEGDYIHDPIHHRWHVSDRLALGMHRAAGGDETKLIALLRLFFFHEYVHGYHSLTKFTATNVGKFPNALERLDYTADTYATFHELDLARYDMDDPVVDDAAQRRFLISVVNQLLQSFWAFDGIGPHQDLQTRRVRRYLNWYWRLAQLERASTISEAVSLFSRSPAIELAGLRIKTDGVRRVRSEFRQAPGERMELAIVTEDDRLARINDSDAAPFGPLIDSFRHGRHDDIKQWFRAIYEMVVGVGKVYPPIHPLLGNSK